MYVGRGHSQLYHCCSKEVKEKGMGGTENTGNEPRQLNAEK